MIVQKAAKVAKGDEDHFARPSLSGRSEFGQRAFAGASSNEKDAPKTGIPIEPT